MFDTTWALVIEDDAHSLIAIASILNELDIRYKRNTTGRAAAQQARTMHPRPHFVLLDLDLPHDDSFHIAGSFKADGALAHIPVIGMSDTAPDRPPDELYRLGFHGLLIKPLPRRDFPMIVRGVLAGRSFWQQTGAASR